MPEKLAHLLRRFGEDTFVRALWPFIRLHVVLTTILLCSIQTQEADYDMMGGDSFGMDGGFGAGEGEGDEAAGTDGAAPGVNGDAQTNGVAHAGTENGATADAGGIAMAQAPAGDRQPNRERITTPYLTKYERARVLGTRALQIRCV